MWGIYPPPNLEIHFWEYAHETRAFSCCLSVPIVGGNCDNGGKCGRYLNVNNTAGNARWNIGASLFLALSFYGITAIGRDIFQQCEQISTALAEN